MAPLLLPLLVLLAFVAAFVLRALTSDGESVAARTIGATSRDDRDGALVASASPSPSEGVFFLVWALASTWEAEAFAEATPVDTFPAPPTETEGKKKPQGPTVRPVVADVPAAMHRMREALKALPVVTWTKVGPSNSTGNAADEGDDDDPPLPPPPLRPPREDE